MKDILFLQFYSRIEDTNPRFKGHSFYEICNGFSDTYDLCKTKGDFIWNKHVKQPMSMGKNLKTKFNSKLPIDKGTIYISAYYFSQLRQVYEWAIDYPNITFMVGGPSANPKTFYVDYSIFPSNMNILGETVEEHFGVPNFSGKWRLDLPPGEDHSMTLLYTYNIRSSCYWGKCNFCNFSQGSRIRKKLNFEFLDVEYNGFQRVALYTPSISPSEIKQIFEIPYNKNMRFDIFLRPDSFIRDALRDVLKNKKDRCPQIKFMFGVDFPSEKMLKYMNKNTTLDDMLKTINVISEFDSNDIQVQLPFIMGWDCLEQSDIDEMEIFLEKIPYDKMHFSFGLTMLSARPNTWVWDNYKSKKDLYHGPFYWGFDPVISDEQLRLSKKGAELLYKYHDVTVFDYYDIRNLI